MNCFLCLDPKEDSKYLLFWQTNYWDIKLAPNQTLLGRCVVSTKRHIGNLAELTDEEFQEFKGIIKDLETALRKAFDPQVFNWSCYMNNAFQEKPYNPHVHWWMVPRYDHKVEFASLEFTDPHFGNPYDHGRYKEFPINVRNKIIERIKRNLK